jgi:flagellar protein FlgJ
MDMPRGGVTSPTDSGAYTDLNRLSNLKVGDRDSDGNLRKVAQEFESLFVGEMLKSMRSANDVLAKDNELNTETVKQYQSMYDQQLSVTMSRQGGIGLQDVLMRQLSKSKDVGHAAGTNPFQRPGSNGTALGAVHNSAADGVASADTAGRNDMAKMNMRRLSLPSKLSDRLLSGIVPSATGTADAARNRLHPEGTAHSNVLLANKPLVAIGATTATTATTAAVASTAPTSETSGTGNGDWTQDPTLPIIKAQEAKRVQIPLAPGKGAFASRDEFMDTMLPMAQEAAARIGVDPKILVAQAALETGYGKSVMRAQDGTSSHNLFGIKASSSWKGEQARAITSEFRNGAMVKETAQFRSYDSYADSFHDLVSLLQNNDRYQGVLNAADNPEQFVKELQKAGYATDPDYASKISQIAKQMKSYQNYAMGSSSTTL